MQTVREIYKAEDRLQQVIAVFSAAHNMQKQVEFCRSRTYKISYQLRIPSLVDRIPSIYYKLYLQTAALELQ